MKVKKKVKKRDKEIEREIEFTLIECNTRERKSKEMKEERKNALQLKIRGKKWTTDVGFTLALRALICMQISAKMWI